VERARLDLLANVESSKSTPKFACCVSGEGDRQDVLGIGRAVEDSTSDPSGEDSRLSRSRRRDDGEGRCVGGDRQTLLGIEASLQVVDVHPGHDRPARPPTTMRP
jgi:hypothetical protein